MCPVCDDDDVYMVSVQYQMQALQTPLFPLSIQEAQYTLSLSP